MPKSEISFLSEETVLEKFREEMRKMSDAELTAFGKQMRELAEPRVGPFVDPWKVRLEMCKQEWWRRHPKK